jgi:hypothetical protein
VADRSQSCGFLGFADSMYLGWVGLCPERGTESTLGIVPRAFFLCIEVSRSFFGSQSGRQAQRWRGGVQPKKVIPTVQPFTGSLECFGWKMNWWKRTVLPTLVGALWVSCLCCSGFRTWAPSERWRQKALCSLQSLLESSFSRNCLGLAWCRGWWEMRLGGPVVWVLSYPE